MRICLEFFGDSISFLFFKLTVYLFIYSFFVDSMPWNMRICNNERVDFFGYFLYYFSNRLFLLKNFFNFFF